MRQQSSLLRHDQPQLRCLMHLHLPLNLLLRPSGLAFLIKSRPVPVIDPLTWDANIAQSVAISCFSHAVAEFLVAHRQFLLCFRVQPLNLILQLYHLLYLLRGAADGARVFVGMLDGWLFILISGVASLGFGDRVLQAAAERGDIPGLAGCCEERADLGNGHLAAALECAIWHGEAPEKGVEGRREDERLKGRLLCTWRRKFVDGADPSRAVLGAGDLLEVRPDDGVREENKTVAAFTDLEVGGGRVVHGRKCIFLAAGFDDAEVVEGLDIK